MIPTRYVDGVLEFEWSGDSELVWFAYFEPYTIERHDALVARIALDLTQTVNNLGKNSVEINQGESEIGFYEGEGLELEDILREQVLLALPMQRVCTESCKGICPGCGKNRNETVCDCRPAVDDRWGALRNLEL